MRPLRRILAIGLLATAVLAGCSSSDKGETAAPSTTSGAPTTTIRPVDTSFTGQNSAQFCTLAKTYNDKFANVGTASSPAQLRTLVQDGRTAVNAARDAAPPEIKADAQALANAFNMLFVELEKVNFDATKVPLAAFSALQAPEFQSATVRFQAYLKNVCGVTG